MAVPTPAPPMPALTDPQLYASGEEHAVWARLRSEDPVSWQERDGFDGFWAVTVFDPGHQVLTDWERFTSTEGTLLRPDRSAPYPGAGKMMVLLDPPRHQTLKRVLWPLFTPRAITRLGQHARQIVQQRLAWAMEAGTCDFVSDVASQLILPIAADVLGIPPEDVERVAGWLDTTVANMTTVHDAQGQEAHVDLLMYYAEKLASTTSDRHDQPNLVSALTAAAADGEDITDEELILACDNVVVGAAETTKQSAACGLWALIEHPAQWRALHDGRVSLHRATEEVLRWTTPVVHVARTARQDSTLLGRKIRRGDPVSVWLPSLNRDERAFPNADTFDLNRSPNRHMTFGGGAHLCIGAALTRLVMHAFLDELAHLPGQIMLAGDPVRMQSFVNGGLASLPVAFQ